MESTGSRSLYDFIESHGFKVILANPLKIKLIAESRMKHDDVDSDVLAKLLMNGWVPESYVPRKEIREIRRMVRTRMQIKQSTTCYGSAFVQTTRAWRNTYIGGESREGEFLISSQFQR